MALPSNQTCDGQLRLLEGCLPLAVIRMHPCHSVSLLETLGQPTAGTCYVKWGHKAGQILILKCTLKYSISILTYERSFCVFLQMVSWCETYSFYGVA